MIFFIVVEFILVTSAVVILENILQAEKARQYNILLEKYKERIIEKARIDCLKLEEEVKALQRLIDENNAKFTKVRGDIDKLNRRRMDLEYIYEDAKRRLKGAQMLGAKQVNAVIRDLELQAPRVRSTYQGLLIGALIALAASILTWLAELLWQQRTWEAKLKEIEKQESKCTCKGLTAQSGGSDFLKIYRIIKKPVSTKISISFSAYRVPDKLIISANGNTIYDSGCIGTGAGGNGQESVSATAIVPANSSVLTVQVIAECGRETGTQWRFSIEGVCLEEGVL